MGYSYVSAQLCLQFSYPPPQDTPDWARGTLLVQNECQPACTSVPLAKYLPVDEPMYLKPVMTYKKFPPSKATGPVAHQIS